MRSPSCSPASRSTAPTCPTGASTSTQAFAAGPAAPARPGRRARRARAGARATRRAAAGAALPADHRHGDGQGRRGLRVLPLHPAHLAQRGRRRPAFRGRRRPSSTTRWRAGRPSWPHAMTTLSTHDTKRGEDVRARIAVLAELPDVWERDARPAARAGAAAGPRLRQPALAGGRSAPGRRRAASGCTPTPRRRCARPATAPRGPTRTQAFEAAVHAAVDAAFDDPRGARRCSTACSRRSPAPGWSNALAAKLLALTMPGVPDVYQGSELWEQSLVDPDNRRPVDFDLRAGCSPSCDAGDRCRRRRRRGRSQAAGHAARRCACAATGPSCSRRTPPVHGDRAGRRPRARLRPRRRDHRRHPAAGRPGSARRLGRHRARPARRDLARRARPAEPSIGRRPRRSPTLLADLPGRAAGRREDAMTPGPFDVWAPRAERVRLSRRRRRSSR